MGRKLGEEARKSDFGEKGEISQVQWRTMFRTSFWFQVPVAF
jgi:hypothetical protein